MLSLGKNVLNGFCMTGLVCLFIGVFTPSSPEEVRSQERISIEDHQPLRI